MIFINRSGKAVGARMFHGDDLVMGFAASHAAVADGATADLNAHRPTGRLSIIDLNLSNLQLGMMDVGGELGSDAYTDAISNSNTVVLTRDGSGLHLIDWTSVRARWSGEDPADTPAGRSLHDGLQITSGVITALATGIAATGPAGALPSGALLLIGTVLLHILGKEDEAPPAPPDVETIKKAMEEVVEEANLRSEARDAATALLGVHQWFLEQAGAAHAAIYGVGAAEGGLGSHGHWEEDFRRNLEKNVDSNEPFVTAIHKCQSFPQMTKYILPAFSAGVATYLHLQWLHDIVRRMDGERLSSEDLEIYIRKCDEAKAGLTAARDAFVSFRTGKVQEEHLLGTPEGEEIAAIINARHTGSKDLAFIDEDLKAINSVVKNLQADRDEVEQGRSMRRYYKPAWDEAPRPPGGAKFAS